MIPNYFLMTCGREFDMVHTKTHTGPYTRSIVNTCGHLKHFSLQAGLPFFWGGDTFISYYNNTHLLCYLDITKIHSRRKRLSCSNIFPSYTTRLMGQHSMEKLAHSCFYNSKLGEGKFFFFFKLSR